VSLVLDWFARDASFRCSLWPLASRFSCRLAAHFSTFFSCPETRSRRRTRNDTADLLFFRALVFYCTPPVSYLAACVGRTQPRCMNERGLGKTAYYLSAAKQTGTETSGVLSLSLSLSLSQASLRLSPKPMMLAVLLTPTMPSAQRLSSGAKMPPRQ
jgi:hypothetical protein